MQRTKDQSPRRTFRAEAGAASSTAKISLTVDCPGVTALAA
jgi:hypothetical protein